MIELQNQTDVNILRQLVRHCKAISNRTVDVMFSETWDEFDRLTRAASPAVERLVLTLETQQAKGKR